MKFNGQLFYAGSCLFELTKGVIFTAVALLLVHLFIATIFVVDGISMEPNFHTNQLVVVNRFTYLFGKPERGDVVVLKFPGDPNHDKYIKRLIGLPGETVDLANNQVYINGKVLTEKYLPQQDYTPIMVAGQTHWVLGSDQYFLSGDNRPNSNDSRTWGPAEKRFLIGKAVFIAFPPKTSGIVPKAEY